MSKTDKKYNPTPAENQIKIKAMLTIALLVIVTRVMATINENIRMKIGAGYLYFMAVGMLVSTGIVAVFFVIYFTKLIHVKGYRLPFLLCLVPIIFICYWNIKTAMPYTIDIFGGPNKIITKEYSTLLHEQVGFLDQEGKLVWIALPDSTIKLFENNPYISGDWDDIVTEDNLYRYQNDVCIIYYPHCRVLVDAYMEN